MSSFPPSTPHDAKHETIKEFCIEEIIKKTLPKHLLTKNTKFLINPTGRFVVGGPQGDTGLTGRKIIVDSYGGMGRHGGGAFSGKDPSKVDRSAAYMGRYVAKNIVAAGLATSAEIQFAYAIGYPDPVSVCVNTFGTGVVSDEAIEKAVCEVFSFKPAAIIKQLNLLRPIYAKTTNYGHFGKNDPDITWERTDKIEELKRAAGRPNLTRRLHSEKGRCHRTRSQRKCPPDASTFNFQLSTNHASHQTFTFTHQTRQAQRQRRQTGLLRPRPFARRLGPQESRSPSRKCPASCPSATNTARQSRSRACASPVRCT